MQIHTEIGEVGLEYAGREYRLRPSFAAMARMGSPAEIVELFGQVLGPAPAPTGHVWADAPRFKRWGRERFLAALTVLHACSDDDLGPLIGGVSPRMAYQPGAMPMDDVVTLAQSLLKHGIVGDVPAEPKAKRGTYSSEFKARDFAALAMAHLGASESDAWAMTMTSFILAMRAKYPPTPQAGDNAPTADAHDATMGWLAAVNAKRSAQ
jgi:hypothetical protein